MHYPPAVPFGRNNKWVAVINTPPHLGALCGQQVHKDPLEQEPLEKELLEQGLPPSWGVALINPGGGEFFVSQLRTQPFKKTGGGGFNNAT